MANIFFEVKEKKKGQQGSANALTNFNKSSLRAKARGLIINSQLVRTYR